MELYRGEEKPHDVTRHDDGGETTLSSHDRPHTPEHAVGGVTAGGWTRKTPAGAGSLRSAFTGTNQTKDETGNQDQPRKQRHCQPAFRITKTGEKINVTIFCNYS